MEWQLAEKTGNHFSYMRLADQEGKQDILVKQERMRGQKRDEPGSEQ
jgi:hypothetical protein